MHIMHTARVSCTASKAEPTTTTTTTPPLMRDTACVTHTHAATPRRLTHMRGLYLNWFPLRRPLDPTFVCAMVAGSPDSSASLSARLQFAKRSTCIQRVTQRASLCVFTERDGRLSESSNQLQSIDTFMYNFMCNDTHNCSFCFLKNSTRTISSHEIFLSRSLSTTVCVLCFPVNNVTYCRMTQYRYVHKITLEKNSGSNCGNHIFALGRGKVRICPRVSTYRTAKISIANARRL